MKHVQPASLEKFTRRDESGTICTASFEIVLYTSKPKSEAGEGAITCYELFLERFRRSLTWYLASSMRKAKKFSQKYADIFPTLCREPKDEYALPFYRVFNGSGMLDYLPPVFATLSDGGDSCLQIHLPSAYASDWEEVLNLVTGLVGGFPFRYGHVGYALCWNDMSPDRDAEVSTFIGPLLKRYPGFSSGNPFELCDQPMPPVNWLTLIGPEMLESIGGEGAVHLALSDAEISVFRLGHGLCVRAGERPQLGDLNRGDDVTLYRKVGSFLKEYRSHPEIELTGLNEEDSEAWLARFDS